MISILPSPSFPSLSSGMSSPQEAESSNSTIRPELLIRVKSGTITEKISDAFTATFRRRQSSLAPSSSASYPSRALSKMISQITLKDIQDAKQCGGGGFGTVRIYEHPTKGKVALKQLRVSGAQRDSDLRRVRITLGLPVSSLMRLACSVLYEKGKPGKT